jgi:hypothetical protein
MPLAKGLPYTDAIARLNAAFHPQAGDLLTHTELRAVVQAEESRYRGVLYAWMRQLRAQGLTPTGSGRARGIGIAFLDGHQDAADIDHKFVLSGRRLRRLNKRAVGVDVSDFTEAEKDHHNLRKRLLGAIAEAATKSNTELRPPAPVVSTARVLENAY